MSSDTSLLPTTVVERDDADWWRSAVVYQVYIRSFADGNGDGIGDLAGLRSKLPYLRDLGVDAIWVNPWYPSPMADAGYDVADFRDIEPAYGALADAEQLIADAHAADIKVIADIVPNHTSDQHAWFRAALADEPGARERYIFRPGRGPNGDEPPNDWSSVFGGSAWTRVDDGAWYLHLFAPAQPDLNWDHPEVRAEFEDVLGFWFDRGLDGFRIDVAHGLAKDPALPDVGELPPGAQHNIAHPAWDQDAVHEIYRGWRRVADAYRPGRMFVAEAWVRNNERLAQYLRPDELHTAFQFDFLRSPWRASMLRAVIEDALDQAATVGAPPTWVLSNHDVVRVATRYARSQPGHLVESEWERSRWSSEVADLVLGRRRARAAALLQLALPGTAYIYQGDELGLDEHEAMPGHARQDPTWVQSGFTDVGRDGCRVPMPFFGDEPPYGFSATGSSTWLPQPHGWGDLTVAAQDADRSSTLWLYRRALAGRAAAFRDAGPIEWLDAPDGVLAFARSDLQCWVNTGPYDVALPTDLHLLLASDDTAYAGTLPPDAAVWATRGGAA